ncbi:MAG: pyridoxal phosphate-dependent aminotransferase [Candidatus Thermoplasmatota archaeon]|nr:pyridoxal phosphate-dependent aminotransferase [Candidatus Thermoplasmatota archaeon]
MISTFSKRIRELAPSGTVMLANRIKKLKSKGVDIISFNLGEPDFDTPPKVVEAAKHALDRGDTHYTPSLGTNELRSAVADHVWNKNGIPAKVDNVMIMPAKFALYAALQALVDVGDEVIYPDPGWVSYGPMVQLAGGVCRPVRMINDGYWHWRPKDIEDAINDRTRAIIINTPSNPTGSVMSLKDLEQIAAIAKDHDLYVISDEIYEDLIYDGKHCSIASLFGMADRTLTVSGLSKSYAMTGWRLGWLIADREIIKMVNKLQQHSLTCLPGFIQQAAVTALSESESVEAMRKEFMERRDMLVPLINSIPGLSCETPQGAFYAFFKADLGYDSMTLSEMLIDRANVALTPGSAFGEGGEGYLRMSYAASREDIAEGMRRIKEVAEGIMSA